MSRSAELFVIAGEPSGDQLAADALRALHRLEPAVVVDGIGGPALAQAGLYSRFDYSELSLMGIAEVLPRVPRLLRRLQQTVDAIVEIQPRVLFTVDAPGFTFRVAQAVRARMGTSAPKMVHYVAPSVWAWKPERARKIAGFLDHLLVLFPFEPPYFEAEGLATTFVGHPVADASGDGARFRRLHGLTPDEPLLAVLPGSRRGEVARLGPIFAEVLAQLDRRPRLVLPTLPHLQAPVTALFSAFDPIITTEQQDKWDAFAAAGAALAASGTATLELAAAATPTVLAYRLHPLTAAIIRRMTRMRFAGLVNILADAPIQPEFIQQNCRTDRILPALQDLVNASCEGLPSQLAAADQIARLRASGGSAGRLVAHCLLTHLERWPVASSLAG